MNIWNFERKYVLIFIFILWLQSWNLKFYTAVAHNSQSHPTDKERLLQAMEYNMYMTYVSHASKTNSYFLMLYFIKSFDNVFSFWDFVVFHYVYIVNITDTENHDDEESRANGTVKNKKSSKVQS